MVVEIEKIKITGMNKRQGSSIGSNAFLSLFRKGPSGADGLHESNPDITANEKPGALESATKRSVYSEFDFSRSGIAQLAKKRNRKGGRFALKRVLPDTLDNFGYLKGLVDLSMEAKFLASLDHPNIISLCGMSSRGPSHFIVIERLRETLSSRLKTWVKIDRQCKGITGTFTGSKRKVQDLYESRISVAYNLACALSYLHERDIIFRDLKPDNCGFDLQDQLKLFDFGLAKELKESDRIEGGLYKLTGMTGAMRYSKSPYHNL